MLKYWVGWVALVLALFPRVAPAALPASAWTQWQSVPGVIDIGGPRTDGSFIVAGSAALYTLTPDGNLQPFARGPGGYRDDPGTEAYMAVSPGLHAGQANCDFARDDVYILRLHTPVGVTLVDKTGEDSGSFINVNAPSLNGIAFDTAGAFDHRLLLTAPVTGKTEVLAVDCRGGVQVLTKSAPQVEGGMAVAPESFGVFAGSLIAPDENTGLIWAIAPDGTARQVVSSGLPAGGDIGVESVGFVPPGFSRGGYVYLADRRSANSPHPGTDSVLRLSSADLVAAGVQDGDLLAATEGGASMIAVRCDGSCRVIPVVTTPTTAHGEGHLAFSVTPQPSPSPSARPTPSATPVASSSGGGVPWIVAILAAVLAGVAGAAIAVAATRRRR
jgi:hypothetical protein